MGRPRTSKKLWSALAQALHTQKIEEMMREMLQRSKDAGDDVRAYFLGYLTHYALDSQAHPYVLHHCYSKKYHMQLESFIDVCLMRRDAFDPKAEPTFTLLGRLSRAQTQKLATVCSALVQKVYGFSISEKEYAQALGDIRRIFRLFLSRRQIKKRFLEAIAGRMGLKSQLRALFYAVQHTPDDDFLNLQRVPWALPWDSTQIQDTSFLMLMEQARAFAIPCLQAAFAYWNGNGTLEQALSAIGSRSMLTGQDWRQKLDTQACVTQRFFPKNSPGERNEGKYEPWDSF